MRSRLIEVDFPCPLATLAERMRGQPGVVWLESAGVRRGCPGFSFLAAHPFLIFSSRGALCEMRRGTQTWAQYGDPWRLLERLLARYELLPEADTPFPLGGCFGFWGYELGQFLEARRSRRAIYDLALPDCYLGFYDSLVAFDHRLGRAWIVATGLEADGSRSARRAEAQVDGWRRAIEDHSEALGGNELAEFPPEERAFEPGPGGVTSSLDREAFVRRVQRALEFIRQGDIYQVNLSQRLTAITQLAPWPLYRALVNASPTAHAAFLDAGNFQVLSTSPELFLRLSGRHVVTRPIKGTRPRADQPEIDAALAEELWTSPKERAELTMITDLLRNDLGRVSEFGSVQVPELTRLERYAHVQHLVSTVEGRLRPDVSHLEALAACFPGGSVTGAPKIRAMEIIDELEPVTRGPYTGALGYIGFNGESQLSITIRTALRVGERIWYHAGAGIVADSDPTAEYEETMAKAAPFFTALAQDNAGAAAAMAPAENEPAPKWRE